MSFFERSRSIHVQTGPHSPVCCPCLGLLHRVNLPNVALQTDSQLLSAHIDVGLYAVAAIACHKVMPSYASYAIIT